MGRIKNIAVKSLAAELIREHGDRFSVEFEVNKKVLDEVRPIKSKRIRNIVAGHIAKEMKKLSKSGI